MKAQRTGKKGMPSIRPKGQKRKRGNDQPYACYLCFLGPGLKYFIPVAFGPLPLKLKREMELAVQN